MTVIASERLAIGTAITPAAPVSDPADLSTIRLMVEIFERQGSTTSGFPRVRPQDCERLLLALQGTAAAQRPLFRTEDPVLTASFANLIAQLRATNVRAYPSEMLKLLVLVAQIRLQQNDHQSVREAIGHYADRPYAMECDFKTAMMILWCDCQARALAGDVGGLPDLAMARMVFLSGLRTDRMIAIVRAFAPFLALRQNKKVSDGLLEAWLVWYCRIATLAERKRGRYFASLGAQLVSLWAILSAAGVLFLRTFGEIRWNQPVQAAVSPLVTRAMGGIGDIIMMSPGLRTLSRQIGAPVRFAIPRRFFPLFENNASVELIDIDGPTIDISREKRWHNLSACPAAAYEARNLPYVKKGRVELFAAGMRVLARDLNRIGQRPEINLGPEQIDAREAFFASKGFGNRPLIGVQPYSRELYRDYPKMDELIRRLAERFDVLIFHHVDTDLPEGPTIATTAGQPLRNSLALVSGINVMVTIDSGFMHAAAALDVPVVALFGPIDGKIRTAHIPQVALLQETSRFPCSPCWRNEDEPCKITGQTGFSPCMAAIPVDSILSAVDNFLIEHKRGGKA